MIAQCFLDTNVLVYAARGRLEDRRKFEIANALIQSEPFCVSAQVLQEFYVAAVRPRGRSRPLDAVSASQWVGWLFPFCEVEVDALLVHEAIGVSQRYRISYWDGAVVAAAVRAKVTTLYTEDLSHLQTYDGVRAVNPFLPS